MGKWKPYTQPLMNVLDWRYYSTFAPVERQSRTIKAVNTETGVTILKF